MPERRGRPPCPALRAHDQPSPILCHSTGPPSPVSSCSRPSARNAVSSPTRHFADFTNWNTPIDQPCAHPRSASPNAAVDLPFISPVCTTSSGRLRRWRVVRPSAGTATGLALGHGRTSLRGAGGVHHAGDAVGGQVGERDQGAPAAAAIPAARPSRTGPASQSTTTVAIPSAASSSAARQASRTGSLPGRAATVARPSVSTTSSGAAAGVAQPFGREQPAGPQQAVRQRRAAAGAQVGEPGLRGRHARGRRQHDLGAGAAERQQPDLVAALVGVAQQRQHRAGDGRHPLARGHRPGGVDGEQHEVALAALALGAAQVAAVAAAGRCRPGPGAAGAVRRPRRWPAGAAPRRGAASRGWDGRSGRCRCGPATGGRAHPPRLPGPRAAGPGTASTAGARRCVGPSPAGRASSGDRPTAALARSDLPDAAFAPSDAPSGAVRQPAPSGRAVDPAPSGPGRRDPGRRDPGRPAPVRGPRRPAPRRGPARPSPARRTGRAGAGAAAPAGPPRARPPSRRRPPRATPRAPPPRGR